MRDDRFDDFSRWAVSRGPSGTRRSFLRAIGLGGTTVAIAPVLSGAAPVPSGRSRTGAAQAEPVDEIEELAFSLDYDIEWIFRFVRDEVVYDPYAGVLRGARGTLWGLAGNAADQAVLLKALLDAALVPARFVVGELTDEGADALLSAGALDAEVIRARGDRLLTPAATASEAAPALTEDQEAFVAKFADFSGQVVDMVDRHVADGVDTVLGALERAGVTLPSPEAVVPESERLRHIWVQYASGPDWIDLDPSVPGAEPGGMLAAEPTVLDEIPADLFHRVSIRLVAEQVEGDGVARNDLLAYEATSSDLVGAKLVLMHPEPDALSNIGIAIGGLLEGYRNFVPTLLVDDQEILGAPVTFGTGGGVLDPFGGGTVEGDTLAEWMEVSVTTPLGTRTATRTVFDRVGAEARAAGPVDPATVAPVDLSGDGEGVTVLTPSSAWMLAVVTGIVPDSVVPTAPTPDATMEDALPALLAYHHARELAIGRQPGLDGCRLFYDAPNVTAFVQQPVVEEADGVTTEFGMDLLHRSVALAPGAGAAGVHPLVAAGVLSHAVETAILESGSLEPVNLPLGPPTGTLRVFAEARAQGIDVLTLLPGASASEIPPVGAGVRATIERALEAGQIVVVPGQPITIDGRERVGMWLVDPVTGATRDQMDDESGGAFAPMAEKALLIRIVCAAAGFYMALTVVIAIKVAQSSTATQIDKLGAVAGAASGVGAAAGCGLA